MTVSIFKPDANIECSSVDGEVRKTAPGGGATWDCLHDACCGAAPNDTGGCFEASLQASGVSNHWSAFRRAVTLFDTSTLGTATTITAATLGIVVMCSTAGDCLASASSIGLVCTTTASNTALEAADFGRVGATRQATDLTVNGITDDQSTYNYFTLNSTGRGNITKDGVTKFAIRNTFDADDSCGYWANDKRGGVTIASTERAGCIGPILTVTYTLPFTPKVMII